MKSRNILVVLVLVALVAAAGFWLYDWVLGETESASAPISAPTLALETAEPTRVAQVITHTSAPEPTPTQPVQTEEVLPAASEPESSPVVYRIDQGGSQVRFNIYEELRGSPKDVVGATDQVAGEVAVDLVDLSAAQVGEILINARTLATEDDRRNRAIRNRILNTDQYEFITFTPTEIIGLSGSAEAGQSFDFRVAGDLTIRDITQPVEFDVSVQVESIDRLVGQARAVVNRADYNLVIPSVPGVANVGEEVTLEIDFLLTPAGS